MILLYAFINLLFVLKYAPRAGIDPRLAGATDLAVVALLAWARRAFLAWPGARRLSAAGFWPVVGAIAVLFALLMRRFDPEAIRVTRYVALHDWITHLLRGEFPYASAVNPSAFPFLFLCALPFHWAGDLGLFQVAGFVAFAWVCLRAARDDAGRALTAVLALAASPLFVWEVVVRSELTSNMTLVLLLLAWIERRTGDTLGAKAPPGRSSDDLVGMPAIVSGLLLSTRGVVAPIYALAFTALFRRRVTEGARFAVVAAITFAATLAPFVTWDRARFLANGPFAIQLSYLPLPLVAAALAIAVVVGARTTRWRDIPRRIALVLAAAVAIPFLMVVASEGWSRALGGDRFDISYFAFAHAFAIAALARPESESRPLDAPRAR